jgi:hypothetical protein
MLQARARDAAGDDELLEHTFLADGAAQLNEHCDDLPADVVFRHARKLGFEGIVSKRLVRPIGRDDRGIG